MESHTAAPQTMTTDIRIFAKLTLLREDEGGRRGPIISGYRPSFRFHADLLDGIVSLRGRDRAGPGETADVDIVLVRPDYLDGPLSQGMKFTAQEGARIVARGEITGIEHFKA
jgi:elongation factor Tu